MEGALVKHFHIYDTSGAFLCVDSDTWILAGDVAYFYNAVEGETVASVTVATFNWSNVVCVREEEDDDEGETITSVPPVFSGALN